MKGFHGYLAGGTLHAARGPDSSTAEEHLGCQVLVRGYIADRASLCRELGLDATRRFSDGELLVHAFRHWGRDLQAHVLGEYAVVILDQKTGDALLTHDALGITPLFYAQRASGLSFATDLIDLVDEEASASLDESHLASFMALGFITSERTPYLSIQRLLPGQSQIGRAHV
jgi:asparagine synthetase B (glutamine-hydrolysing)